jgi:LuxR family transcriptional regulator, maltose regulon positive regulatory protein
MVLRPRLIEQLNEGLSSHRKLTLISAPAGFSKTMLVSEWILDSGLPTAWLSLDEGDNDLSCFLTYLVAALQTIAPNIGAGALPVLQSPQPPSIESILTTLLNEITTIPDTFILVLDDYHVIVANPVNQALTFLLEHLPPQIHLVIATREDPPLPLARLRARGQLTELRAADLRFTPAEAADFLNQVMGLNLAVEEIAALEARTEGWIAGLQLAALSMQGCQDAASFIKSFTGSHHFILDYLVEEVLQRQSESIQTFLLRTSILHRLCGPLCDAVLGSPSASGQEILENLERANLFIVPLDNERRWYRYHHLFAELLRQRLHQCGLSVNDEGGVAEYHLRASRWYEDQGLEIEAFQHAAAGNDVERAERIILGKGLPLHFRGAVAAILDWLASLPKTILDSRPSLCVRYATLSLVSGQMTGVEEKLQAAETALAAALQGAEPDDKARDLIGQIAAARATLALTRYQPEAMIAQARRALEYLPPDSLYSRTRAIWTLGFAYQVQGDRAAAGQAYIEAIDISQASGDIRNTIVATISLGAIQELENHLFQAAESFRTGLQLAGDHPQPFESEAHLGLGRIFYEWNDLEAAEQHGQQGLQLARQFDRVIDRYILSEVFLARLKLARGDVVGAAALLAEIAQSVRQNNFVHRKSDVAAVQMLVLLRQGDLAAAAQLARTHELPISQARVHLAQGDPSAALALLSSLRQQMEAKDWQDERLKVMVLQAVAHNAHGQKDKAAQLLSDALALAEPGGFIRLFVDEGEPMRMTITDFRLSIEKPPRGEDYRLLGYVDKLLAAFANPAAMPQAKSENPNARMLEPLSQRELEVLKLVAQGLSNHEIGERLFLALDTIKGHNRNIYSKLQVQRRTEAIARALELGLL